MATRFKKLRTRRVLRKGLKTRKQKHRGGFGLFSPRKKIVSSTPPVPTHGKQVLVNNLQSGNSYLIKTNQVNRLHTVVLDKIDNETYHFIMQNDTSQEYKIPKNVLETRYFIYES